MDTPRCSDYGGDRRTTTTPVHDGVNKIALLAMAKIHPATRDLFVDYHSQVDPSVRPQALDVGISNTKNDKLNIILENDTCPDDYDGITVIENVDPSMGDFKDIKELKAVDKSFTGNYSSLCARLSQLPVDMIQVSQGAFVVIWAHLMRKL
jgi:hypothetical protein